MVGALSIMGSSMVDSHTSPCLCLDALPLTNMNLKSGGDLVFHRNSMSRKRLGKLGSVELSSSFIDSRRELRLSRKALSGIVNRSSRKQRKDRRFVIVNELGGQYEDTFEDVKTQILNYFTYKAVRTVLNQLYEMNPTQYRWFYEVSEPCVSPSLRNALHMNPSDSFVASNKPNDGKRFIRSLGKEKQDLAERVMITRLHLYGKWVKKCNHAEIYQEISDQNLELMRERLMETVIWPSDDTNTERIG